MPATPFKIGHSRYDPQLTPSQQIYCLFQFSLVLLITTHFLETEAAMPLTARAAYALWITISLWITGGLMEHRSYYVRLEAIRLLATAAGILTSGAWFGVLTLPSMTQAAITMAVLGSLIALGIVFKPRPTSHGNFSSH